LHPRVCSLLETCLADNRQAWDLHRDGTYVQRKPGANPVVSTHERLLQNSWGIVALPAGADDTRTVKEMPAVGERLTA
jgi:polyphosphate kinase